MVLSVNLAELQLPVSEQSHRDLEQSTSYKAVAAASPDVPLLVPFDAVTAFDTTPRVEPYVPPVLPGSSYVAMPYVPSIAAQLTSQAVS